MLFRLQLLLASIVFGTTLAQAQERQWYLDQTDQEAYLVFGVPETDDAGVSFWCNVQSGSVKLYEPDADPKLKAADSVPFDVVVADKPFHLKGKTAINEESGSISIEAELKSTDPLFAAFQDANRFSIKIGKSVHIYPLQDADFPAFLDVCKKP